MLRDSTAASTEAALFLASDQVSSGKLPTPPTRWQETQWLYKIGAMSVAQVIVWAFITPIDAVKKTMKKGSFIKVA